MPFYSGRNYIKTAVIFIAVVILFSLVFYSVEISILPVMFFIAGLVFLFLLQDAVQLSRLVMAEALIYIRGPPPAF